MPTSILGGGVMLTGSSADIISSYAPEVEALANIDSRIISGIELHS